MESNKGGDALDPRLALEGELATLLEHASMQNVHGLPSVTFPKFGLEHQQLPTSAAASLRALGAVVECGDSGWLELVPSIFWGDPLWHYQPIHRFKAESIDFLCAIASAVGTGASPRHARATSAMACTLCCRGNEGAQKPGGVPKQHCDCRFVCFVLRLCSSKT